MHKKCKMLQALGFSYILSQNPIRPKLKIESLRIKDPVIKRCPKRIQRTERTMESMGCKFLHWRGREPELHELRRDDRVSGPEI